jgi:hypothetical protein
MDEAVKKTLCAGLMRCLFASRLAAAQALQDPTRPPAAAARAAMRPPRRNPPAVRACSRC